MQNKTDQIPTYKLLIIDDDVLLLNTLKEYFTNHGFIVYCAENAAQGLPIIRHSQLDCIILDISLPGEDGFSICQKARELTFIPILFLSNYSGEENRIKSFLTGGDDFIAKPFSMKELLLRVNARIRLRPEDHTPQALFFDGLTIDPGMRIASYQNKSGNFSRIEFDILFFLASHPARVFTYEQIYNAVWNEPINQSRHNLQARMAELRQKLYELCPGKSYIKTLRHKGYCFNPEGR